MERASNLVMTALSDLEKVAPQDVINPQEGGDSEEEAVELF